MIVVTHRPQAGIPASTLRAWQEVDALFGSRLKAIGAWGDAAHALRPSCHNTARALDLMTSDPKTQDDIVIWALASAVRLDIRRVIVRKRVWARLPRGKWSNYHRTPHNDHVHLSIACDL